MDLALLSTLFIIFHLPSFKHLVSYLYLYLSVFLQKKKMGPVFLEQKGNVLRVIQPALRSTLGVYDLRPPIVIYM